MLQIINNFFSEETEAKIVNLLPKKARSNAGRNQVLRFGQAGAYGQVNNVQIPEVFKEFKDRIEFDSITLNEYLPGDSIPYHVDDLRQDKELFILSLLSDCELKFKIGNKEKSANLPRLSLAIISGTLRQQWEHSLTAKERRVSVVLRLTGKPRNQRLIELMEKQDI